MVSKEPNHLLSGQTNGKSALAEKSGTMTVRSVLLNRDSPDIESRLRRRRNRTHQVRFKDLEDGSSSSGNSGTGDNSNHQRSTADCNSPHPLRKNTSRSLKGPWEGKHGLHTGSLPGQTSVVGAVRGDMASTIEVVAAFLARAPPHPLTPGPIRRCWAPPTNSLTLPMTRKPSTSTAIQTSPCLKKSLSSTHPRTQSLGDSLGIDGDDEQDSQDEYLTSNHKAPSSLRDLNVPQGPAERTVIERRSKLSRVDMKSNVDATKISRHSCPPSVLHNTELFHCLSTSSRDGSKRQGSVTPSLVRRRKRLNRTTSDPGKEVHYCTTPTQTESSRSTLSHSDIRPSRVETDCTSTHSKYSTIQIQTAVKIQDNSSNSAPPLNVSQCTTQVQTNSPLPPATVHQPSQMQTPSPCPSPPPLESPNSDQIEAESHMPANVTQDPFPMQITTVPYCTSPPSASAPSQNPEACTEPPCFSSIEPAIVSSPPSTALPFSCSAPTAIQNAIPYYTHVRPIESNSPLPACSTPLPESPACPTTNANSLVPNVASPVIPPCLTPTPTPAPANNPDVAACDHIPETISHPEPQNVYPATNGKTCTIVTQTALSCTSISYYTTTHTSGSLHNPTTPSCATLIQTVAQCNIPCQPLQNASSVSMGVAPYSSMVAKLTTCRSPPPLVNLPNVHHCTTPTKAVPLYSFRAAPPYTPPSQAPLNTQDKRGIRLPPPAPSPPPYTPRKKGNDPQSAAARTPMLRAESKANEMDKDEEKPKKDVKCTDKVKLCERASSLKQRAKTPPVCVVKGEKTSSPAKACFKSSCLNSAQAQLGVLHKILCAGANVPNSEHTIPPNQQGCSGAKGCAVSQERPLTPTQADTLRQVQEILGGLVSGAKCKLDPARVTEKLLGPNGPLRDIRSLQNHLHSLEGVLETSQNTIKILLDVIQDLEKKEAERDGRHSYRTGQDIENCGTCRDCACIIYSVEHDFRLQEGQVVRTWKVGDPPEGSPQTSTPPSSTPSQQDSPQAVRPAATTKKNRKKCFWFL